MRKVLDDLEVPETYREGEYSPEIEDEIVQRVRAGEGVQRICKDAHMPPETTVVSWYVSRPEFGARIREARVASGVPPKGRRSIPFDQAIADEFCARTEAGEPLLSITSDDHMPEWKTILKWRRENPDFQANYLKARELSAESCEHNAIQAALRAVDKDSAAAARVQADTWLRVAGIRNPATHGHRFEAKISVEIGLADRLSAAMARIAGQTIEGEVTEIVSEMIESSAIEGEVASKDAE